MTVQVNHQILSKIIGEQFLLSFPDPKNSAHRSLPLITQ